MRENLRLDMSGSVEATIEELRWWLDLLAEADRLHQQLPTTVIREIEAAAGAHELMRLAIMWSAVSCEARQRVRGTLEHAMCAVRTMGEVTPPSGQLRLVASED